MAFVERNQFSENVHDMTSSGYNWLESQYVFRFILDQSKATGFTSSNHPSMYDVYNQMYPEYFRSVMQLPPLATDSPTFTLGMYADICEKSSSNVAKNRHELNSTTVHSSQSTEISPTASCSIKKATSMRGSPTPKRIVNENNLKAKRQCSHSSCHAVTSYCPKAMCYSEKERMPCRQRWSGFSDAQGNGLTSQGSSAGDFPGDGFGDVSTSYTMSQEAPDANTKASAERSCSAQAMCPFTAPSLSASSSPLQLKSSHSKIKLRSWRDSETPMTKATAVLLYVKSKVAEKQRAHEAKIPENSLQTKQRHQKICQDSAFHVARDCMASSHELNTSSDNTLSPVFQNISYSKINATPLASSHASPQCNECFEPCQSPQVPHNKKKQTRRSTSRELSLCQNLFSRSVSQELNTNEKTCEEGSMSLHLGQSKRVLKRSLPREMSRKKTCKRYKSIDLSLFEKFSSYTETLEAEEYGRLGISTRGKDQDKFPCLKDVAFHFTELNLNEDIDQLDMSYLESFSTGRMNKGHHCTFWDGPTKRCRTSNGSPTTCAADSRWQSISV